MCFPPSPVPSCSIPFIQHFFREAVLWFNIDHKNVIKVEGIAHELDGLSEFCIVLQWAENRDLRHHLDRLIIEGLAGQEYVRKVNKWVCCLVYLGVASI